MRVTYLEREDTFVALTQYHEREIPKLAGFKWNPARKFWETKDARRALNLRAYADSGALHAIEMSQVGVRLHVATSKLATTDLQVPAPVGLAFRDYQRAGVAYAKEREFSLIADEMGLGKTVQAVGLINVTNPVPNRVLVICPASLRLNWKEEARRWLTHKMNVMVVTNTWFAGIRHDDPLAPPLVVIISYRAAVLMRRHIEDTQWDMLIVDECHMLCNSKTQQSKAVLGGARATPDGRITYPPIKAKKTVFLTGTPIVNRPRELWPIIHRCDRKGLGGDWVWFRRRYIESEQFLPELHDYLRSSFMVRRLKTDVETELPPKRRQILLVEPEGDETALARERELVSRKAAELAALKHENAVQKLNQWRGAAMTEISKIRHDTALLKVPAVAEHVFNVLDEAEKVVLFAHHHDVIDQLAYKLGNVVTVFDGRVTPAERDVRIKRFMTDPACRVFIGSIRAAGLGLTLTAASIVIFAELDWTPAAMVQAEDRLHRIGQKSSVLVQHLVIDGSIDQRMANILIEKARMMDMILDGKVPEGSTQSILEEVLRSSK